MGIYPGLDVMRWTNNWPNWPQWKQKFANSNSTWNKDLFVASQISNLTVVYSTVYSDADHRKHQSSASLAFDTNDTSYNEYFQWQHHYKASLGNDGNCHLCAYLHLNKPAKKIYPDVRQWYSKSRCIEPKEYYGSFIDIAWIGGTSVINTSPDFPKHS